MGGGGTKKCDGQASTGQLVTRIAIHGPFKSHSFIFQVPASSGNKQSQHRLGVGKCCLLEGQPGCIPQSILIKLCEAELLMPQKRAARADTAPQSCQKRMQQPGRVKQVSAPFSKRTVGTPRRSQSMELHSLAEGACRYPQSPSWPRAAQSPSAALDGPRSLHCAVLLNGHLTNAADVNFTAGVSAAKQQQKQQQQQK